MKKTIRTISKLQIQAALKKFFKSMNQYPQRGMFNIELETVLETHMGNKVFYWPEEKVMTETIQNTLREIFQIECPTLDVDLFGYTKNKDKELTSYILTIYWSGR